MWLIKCLENLTAIEKLYNKVVEKFWVSLVLLLQEI